MNRLATSLARSLKTPLHARTLATVAPPKLFSYDLIRQSLKERHAIESVEAAFGQLSKGKVDVPTPMHITIDPTPGAGPGDCHIKGGYVSGGKTYTVKLANVGFMNNAAKGLPLGSGIFMVMCADTGNPLGIFQENRYMTDLRTGAAGAISVKHFAGKDHGKVGFVGTGVIAKAMLRATATLHNITEVYAYDVADAQPFCDEMSKELKIPFHNCSTAEEMANNSDIIFTQTPGSNHVLQKDWLKPHATIIASGSDQPTKNELPSDILANSKVVVDLVKQCATLGELRTALKDGVMTEADVYAEIGEVVLGEKPGREGDEMIVVDLTGTGAQDAAIGQVAWDMLG